MINISFFHFLMKPLTLMKLFLFLLLLIFMQEPADPASTSFTRCLRHSWSNAFSQSRLIPSWSYFWNTLRNYVIFVDSIWFLTLPNSLASGKISYRTYNPCSTILLTWPNRFARKLILIWLPCLSLILPALKPGLLKTIPNTQTVSSSSWKLLPKPTTLIRIMTHTKPPMALCPHMLPLTRQSSRCMSMDISAMPANSVSLPMVSALFVTSLFTTRTF